MFSFEAKKKKKKKKKKNDEIIWADGHVLT